MFSKLSNIFTFLILFSTNVFALEAGDVAVIGYNTDDQDEFAWVALVDIPASTTIKFTDDGVNSDDSFRGGEGIKIWSHTSQINAGTVITRSGSTLSTGTFGSSGSFIPSASGDQLIVYTGTEASPTFIFAVNIANSGWITSGEPGNTNESYQPSTLSDGTTAIHVGSSDNGYYNDANGTSGNKTELLALIGSNSNWTTSNDDTDTGNWASSFTVSASSVQNPTAFTVNSYTATQAELTWTAPGGTYDAVLIFGRDGAEVDHEPSGAGSSYSDANSAWSSAGSYNNSKLLYSGTGSTVTVTGLTEGNTYYFKSYSYDDSNWSSGTSNISVTTAAPAVLMISEVTDPGDVTTARFAELYNSGGQTVDFSTETWNLCLQTNGGSNSWNCEQLTGTVNAGETYIACYSDTYFPSNYNQGYDVSTGFNANGDDGYFLYKNGDYATGTLVDAFGVIDQDGTGQAWEYADSQAQRKISVTSPNTTWTASEWSIISADVADMTPRKHPATRWDGSTDSDWTDATNWNCGVPGTTSFADITADGTSPQISSAVSLQGLRMLGGSLGFSGSGTLTVNDTLKLSTGLITTSGSNLLTISNTGWITGGSGSSYVNGPLAKEYSNTGSEFVFEIGGGGSYRKIGFQPNGSISTGEQTYTAQYFNSTSNQTVNDLGVNLTDISSQEYWTLSCAGCAALTDQGYVTIYYSADQLTGAVDSDWDSSTGGGDGTEYQDLVVAQYNGVTSLWDSQGRHGCTPGTSGSVTSGSTDDADGYDVNHFDSNTKFTLGRSGTPLSNNPLITQKYSLSTPYPNPFNPQTTISYSLEKYGPVSICAYDVHGREAAVLANLSQHPGEYTLQWDARQLPSGIYFIRMTAEDFQEIRKVMLLK